MFGKRNEVKEGTPLLIPNILRVFKFLKFLTLSLPYHFFVFLSSQFNYFFENWWIFIGQSG